jgi:Concanavalin A-like lectin/glucanases superfamily
MNLFTHLARSIAIVLALSVQGYAQSSLTDGLVAYYPFNGNANDESDFHRDGIVYGATLSADRFGNQNACFSFDGHGQYIRANKSINDVTNNFTISIWFKTTNTYEAVKWPTLIFPSSAHVIWDETSAGVGISAGIDKILVHEHAAGYLPTVIEYAGDFKGWTLVTLVYNNRTPTLYVNGILKARGNASPRVVRPSSGMFEGDPPNHGGFGGIVTDNPYWLQQKLGIEGELDDIRIYRRALSATEVQQLYTLEASQSNPCDGTPAKLEAVISKKTGTQVARHWTLRVNNRSFCPAIEAQIDSVTLTQTYGTPCTPVITSPKSFPIKLGDIGAKGSAESDVVVNFTGCPSNARFTVKIAYSFDRGAVKKVTTLNNQFR